MGGLSGVFGDVGKKPLEPSDATIAKRGDKKASVSLIKTETHRVMPLR